MKKTTAFFLAVAMSIDVSFSQSSVWKVINNDGNTLYLGGSVHILRAEDYPLPIEFNTAFEKSDILILEADATQMQNPEVAQSMMAQMMLPGEETLQTVLNAETFKLLKKKCEELSLPLQEMLKLKPAVLATMLAMAKMLQMGFTPEGVDTYFHAKAMENNMKVDFLESVDFQINLLVNMGEGFENEFMKYMLDDLDNIQADIDILIPEWRIGKSEFLASKSAEMKEQFPIVYKTMLTDRDSAWLPIIENYLTDEPVEFIVVGLGHLIGEEGLLMQLENKGYTVKQVE